MSIHLALPKELNNMLMDREAIANLTSSSVEEDLKKMGVDIEELDNQNFDKQIWFHLRRIEMKFTDSERKLLLLIEEMAKRIENLEKELKSIKKLYATAGDGTTMSASKSTKSPLSRPKKRLDKPIDRNGVPPEDVKLEKFFNFSHKRF